MAGVAGAVSRREVVRFAAAGAATATGLGSAAAARATRPQKIMIVRHAEKPADDGSPPFGVGTGGEADKHALLVRGWQRAGALARFFAPRDGRFADPALARPAAVIAAAPSAEHKSERSVLTVSPLAALLVLPVDTRFDSDDTAGAAAAALAVSGPVLLAWEHKRIARLVAAVTGGAIAPPHWPGTRFDMVLVLDRDGEAWRLTQVPQLLLAGDSADPLPPKDGGSAD